MNPCQPPNCPCFCPTADLPIAPIVVAQGGPAVTVTLPIYGTQPFQVSITDNPQLPVAGVGVIASVQVFNGNILTITTAVPDILETLGNYVATIQVCNACGTFTTQVQVEVAADLNPVLTNCVLAQALWTPEAREPAVGDTLLAFTPAGCRALLPPTIPDVCAEIQAFAPVVPTLATQLATADCGLATVADVLALYPLCTNLQAFPAAVGLDPTDGLIVFQGPNCRRTTFQQIIDEVDLCTQFQNLPNAVVQPTASFFGEQAGNCFQFLVADLLALAVPDCPFLATCDGSCAAPAYSFASSPTSGMWFDPTIGPNGAVVISDNNCANQINVGASIQIIASTTDVAINAGDEVTITAADRVAILSTGDNVSLSAPTGDILLLADELISIRSLTDDINIGIGVTPDTRIFLDLTTQSINLVTSTLSRLQFSSVGEWLVAGLPGVLGQTLTSMGPGTPPLWVTPAPVVVAFPLLAPNGSCIAPSYSFTASPDSGLFYTGTAVRLSDDNCADFIDVGTSITASTTTNFAIQAFSGNVSIFASNSSGTLFINGFNSTYTGTGTTTLSCTATNAGSLNINTSATSLNAAPINIAAGGSSAATGGAINISAGGGATTAGSVIVFAGNTNTGTAGSIELQAGAATSGTPGSVNIRAGQASAGPDGTVGLWTNGTARLTIGGAGGWAVGGGEGTAGQALTSNGAGVSPTWQNVSPSFPLLAPNGSCAAPSYSFTASPDSGMFYTGTAVRISDDNCGDYIEVGASINVVSGAGSNISVTTSSSSVGPTGNINITVGAVLSPSVSNGGSITITAGSTDVGAGQAGHTIIRAGADVGSFLPGNVYLDIPTGFTNNGLVHVSNNLLPVWTFNSSGLLLSANGAVLEVATDNGYTASNQTSGAGANVGTLTNAPSAGDPAFWLRVVINGANRFIPCWA